MTAVPPHRLILEMMEMHPVQELIQVQAIFEVVSYKPMAVG
jgi:hypothetical protein